MKIKVFPRDLLETKWSSDKTKFDNPGTPSPTCLRCGKPLNKDFYHNKLCRYMPVTICCACGDDEAVRTYSGKMLPFEQWHAVTHGEIDTSTGPQTAFLTPISTSLKTQSPGLTAAPNIPRAWLRTPVPITMDTDGTLPGLTVLPGAPTMNW